MTDIKLNKPKTKEDALTLALYLSITAPDDIKSKECVKYASILADSMSSKEVELCKMAAEVLVEYELREG